MSDLQSLYQTTLSKITKFGNWQHFLKSACYNYKRDFDDQVLIYAQNPNATAVMSGAEWQSRFERTILPEHTGIRLFAEAGEDGTTKTAYDISDTAAGQLNIPVFQFQNTPEQTAAAIDALVKLSQSAKESRMETALLSAAELLAAERMELLMPELLSVVTGSPAQAFSERVLKNKIIRLIANSSAYMNMVRCNLPIENVFLASDFRDISVFSPEAVSIIGYVMNQTTADLLKTIIRSQINFENEQKNNKSPIARPEQTSYNEATNTTTPHTERIDQNDNELIRKKTAELPEGKQTSLLPAAENQRQAQRTSGRDTSGSQPALEHSDRTESASLGHHGRTQSGEYDPVERPDDQFKGVNQGTGIQRDHLQLKSNKQKKAAEFTSTLPLFLSHEQIDDVLISGSHSTHEKYRILEQFLKKEPSKQNADFLKKEYGIGGSCGPGKYSINYDGKGLEIITPDDKNKYHMSWNTVAKRIEQLITSNRYLTAAEVKAYQEYLAEKQDIRTQYVYQSGDEVYIGAKTLEILNCTDRVVLCDADFPLYQESFTVEEFEKKLSENPLNQQLKVAVTEKAASNPVQEAPSDKQAPSAPPNKGETQTAKPILDRGDEMLAQALIGYQASLKTGVNVIGFEEGSTQPILPPSPAPSAQEPKPQPHNDKPAASNYHITNFQLGAGGPKERFQNNMAAIRTLQSIESENRTASPEEQDILANYVGWGGLSDAFDDSKSNWSNEYQELLAALSPDDYAAARTSTLTAFYTPPVVIKYIYQALENMGFQTGNILDPACGTGHFVGMLPESMSKSKVYATEIDSLSGRIAKQLYPEARIAIEGFEKTKLPDSFFDVAVGNVPFGDFKVTDKKYDKLNFYIHDYFFAKSIDKLRPGGVIAFITSNGISGGTFDKKDKTVREYLAQRCDLLGAVRLPDDTFKRIGGTDVNTDILFLQKRTAERNLSADTPEWVETIMLHEQDYTNAQGEIRHNFLTMNRYFETHPKMILGTHEIVSGAFGPQLVCKSNKETNFVTLLSNAVSNIHAEITEYKHNDLAEKEHAHSIPADPDVRNFSYTAVDGEIYFRENSMMEHCEVSQAEKGRIQGMIAIRDSVRRVLDYQTIDAPDAKIQAAQEELSSLYDTFAGKYGLLVSRTNKRAFEDDSSSPLLFALEILNDEGEFVQKADIFTKRTIRAQAPVTHVDTATEALAVSISERAKIDMAFMEQLSGKTEAELFSDLQGIIFLNPEYSEDNRHPKYVPGDEYLSGNVREKLALAQECEIEDPIYHANVDALKKVQPQELTAAEISIQLGSIWVPVDIVNQFMYELLETPSGARSKVAAAYIPQICEWKIRNRSYDSGNIKASSTYGTVRAHAYRIIEDTLNLRDTRIYDTVRDSDGKEKSELNTKETAIAQGKQDTIRQAFVNWVWKDQERRRRLCKLYNEQFNSIRPREYDGSHITCPGMNPEIVLRPHQKDAIAHMLYGGNTLLAHVVGAGKTFEMVGAAMESKRLGLCQKSLFVVPNHLTEQWAAEFLLLYPNANLLVARKKDFEKQNRKRFCSKIATGLFDAIIIGQSQFEKLPMSYQHQREIINEQIKQLMDGIAQAKKEEGSRFTIKSMMRTQEGLKTRLSKLNDQSRKDDVLTFEQLGVDKLFVDEAHFYKNLFTITKMRNVAGIGQASAQKSSDLFMKCRYLDQLTGGKGVVFATGTPISNSMVELYTMQRYLQYDTLKKAHMENFDEWASNFGQTTTEMELTPEGTGYRFKTRFSKFHNLPELMSMFKMIADIKTADMLNLPVPETEYHNVVVQPSTFQREYIAELAERAEAIHKQAVDPHKDNMLRITNEGRKLALDERLINPKSLVADTKLEACAQNIMQIWKDTAEQRAAQLFFCDLSTPSSDNFNVYHEMKNILIDMGIPEQEIAFIHDANTEIQKKNLFAKVRSGKVRVLFGSTQKMGAGTNVQERLAALHHQDCPWRPSDLEQREGRIIRQGNQFEAVSIYRYVTENTFDSYMWQLVEKKQKFIAQIMTSKTPVRTAEDIDEVSLAYGEVKALASGNPLIMEKCKLDAEVSKLNLQKSHFLTQKFTLEDKITLCFPKEIKEVEQRLKGLKTDLETANAHPVYEGEFAGIELQNVTYKERAEAGKALMELACNLPFSLESHAIGSYRGFSLIASFYDTTLTVSLQGSITYPVDLGMSELGNIIKIENAISSITDRLEQIGERLNQLKQQFETAKTEVKNEFPNESELIKKSEKLARINAILSANQKEKTREVG